MNRQSLLSLEEELVVRAHATEVYNQTWGKATGLDAKKAFVEGFYMACTIGVISIKTNSKLFRSREDTLNKIIALLIVLLVFALAL